MKKPIISKASQIAGKFANNKFVKLVSLFLLVLFCFIIGKRSIEILIIILITMLVHELGHYSLMYKFGWSPTMLFAYGGACVIPRAKPTQTTFGQEFYSVLAGPGMNGISALICALFFWSNPLALPFVALNSLIGILNLGVGPILDGGHLFNLSVDNVKTKSQKALVTLLHSPFIFLIVPVIFYFFRGNLFWTTVAFTASIWFIYNAYNKADSLTAIENGGSFIPQTGMKKTLIGIANQYIVLAILALSPIIVLERLGKLNLAINLIIVELYKLGILKYIHF